MQDFNDTSDNVEVRHSIIHGHGAFVARDIPAGAALGRYAGRRYSAKHVARKSWDSPETDVFGLSSGSIIDGAKGGNDTRYVCRCGVAACRGTMAGKAA